MSRRTQNSGKRAGRRRRRVVSSSASQLASLFQFSVAEHLDHGEQARLLLVAHSKLIVLLLAIEMRRRRDPAKFLQEVSEMVLAPIDATSQTRGDDRILEGMLELIRGSVDELLMEAQQLAGLRK